MQHDRIEAFKSKAAETKNQESTGRKMPYFVIPAAFLLIEIFAFIFVQQEKSVGWPLAFGVLWSCIFAGFIGALPWQVGRIVFAVGYFLFAAYAIVQTGYYFMFSQMMWISDFRYASEGSEFFSVLLQYPLDWWLWTTGLLVLGIVLVFRFPVWRGSLVSRIISGAVMLAAICSAVILPKILFQYDRQVQYAETDYGRAQSAEAAYTNMYSPHRLYQICGIYQTAVKDVYRNLVSPLMPGYVEKQEQARAEIDAYFASRGDSGENAMTGVFEGKNVIFVLMESMDDWLLGDHTPTINYLMERGINFTNFYTPVYGSVRTFNTEFCANTGSFLSSQGGYAFDYVTNDFRQSLANQLAEKGYSAKVYHYNSPSFYSRGVFSPAMGYEEYVSYEDYVTQDDLGELYDDQFLFNNAEVSDSFFREGQKLNFIITRSAHLSYQYNEVLSHWGLQKYPQYRGMTGSEEDDCAYLKAKLVDDMFARLLQELDDRGELEETVIVAYTDHYTYGYKDTEKMMERSGVEDPLLLERTPFFIWSPAEPAMRVEKTLNTSDLLPTVLNLMGVESPYEYMGKDAFDENYIGYALFPDGSWVCDGVAYSASSGRTILLEAGETFTREQMEQMAQTVNSFVHINNLILETDYYAQ